MSSEPIIYTSPFPPVKLQFSSIFSFIFGNKESIDNSPAYIDAISGIILTRAKLYDQAMRLAWGTRMHGLNRGDVAMIFSPNSLAWPIVFFGNIAAGVKLTLANSSYLPRELAHQLRDSNASLVFVHPTLLSTLEKTLEHLNITVEEARKKVVIMSYSPQDELAEEQAGIGKEWVRLKDLLSMGILEVEEKFDGQDSFETVLLCYSSGTTGLSKGVETTHRNIIATSKMFEHVYPKGDPTKDISGAVLPFYHIYVIVVLFFGALTRVPVVILPRFEPELFLWTIQKYRISLFMLVPPTILFMATSPLIDKYDLSSLRVIMSGAAPLGTGLTKRFIARLQANGAKDISLIQGYGLTETSPTTHLVPLEWSTKKIGSCGMLLPNLEARLVDDDGNDVIQSLKRDIISSSGGDSDHDVTRSGELWLRGPSVMKGYLNNPSATRKSLTPDGWFKTSDVATRDDDGFYYIIDRKKELIKYKGFQVPPAELEALLLTRDDILDVGVVGIKSIEEATELPRAYIVSKRNAELFKDKAARKMYEDEVQEWLRPKVARYKWLRGGVVVVESIPKLASGKILRRHLRELAKKELITGKL